jgi:hypothetical protein
MRCLVFGISLTVASSNLSNLANFAEIVLNLGQIDSAICKADIREVNKLLVRVNHRVFKIFSSWNGVGSFVYLPKKLICCCRKCSDSRSSSAPEKLIHLV